MAKLKLTHNLSDEELEEVLEKALKKLREPITEPKREYPDLLATGIRDEVNGMFDKILENMFNEIQTVLEEK